MKWPKDCNCKIDLKCKMHVQAVETDCAFTLLEREHEATLLQISDLRKLMGPYSTVEIALKGQEELAARAKRHAEERDHYKERWLDNLAKLTHAERLNDEVKRKNADLTIKLMKILGAFKRGTPIGHQFCECVKCHDLYAAVHNATMYEMPGENQQPLKRKDEVCPKCGAAKEWHMSQCNACIDAVVKSLCSGGQCKLAEGHEGDHIFNLRRR